MRGMWEVGHDVAGCLDESDIRVEGEIKQAVGGKQKELNRMDRRLQEVEIAREMGESRDEDADSVPEQGIDLQEKEPKLEGHLGIRMTKPLIRIRTS